MCYVNVKSSYTNGGYVCDIMEEEISIEYQCSAGNLIHVWIPWEDVIEISFTKF